MRDQAILSRVCKVRATQDNKEAARLLESGEWIAIGAAMKEKGTIEWSLAKIRDVTPALSDEDIEALQTKQTNP